MRRKFMQLIELVKGEDSAVRFIQETRIIHRQGICPNDVI
jgi:hypothetical protein